MSSTSEVGEPGVKAILGYDIAEGVTVEDYERWLAEVHFPDLLANPHLDRLVANDVVRPITATSAGSATTSTGAEPVTFYRIMELHFADHDAYRRYLDWFEQNPIDPSRGPAGRTEFGFYVLTESTVIDRDRPYQPPAEASAADPT
ncbi:MAG: hypothetical protein OER95_00090 [Acidimicrobiia bacterium]|nr:hypothetical protein [Acidimicrobiia bacterium]